MKSRLILLLKFFFMIFLFGFSAMLFALDNDSPSDQNSMEEIKKILKGTGLDELEERAQALREGKPTKEIKVGDLVFPAMSQAEVDTFKFNGGPTGTQIYTNGKNSTKQDAAFLLCWQAARKALLDADAEFNTTLYNYAGRRKNDKAYVVDVFVVAHNSYNAKINATIRCRNMSAELRQK